MSTVPPADGPDLPPPGAPFTVDHLHHRWPLAVWRVEMIDGVAIYAGPFDERDVAAAARTFPGRRVALTADRNLIVGTSTSLGPWDEPGQ